MSCQPDHSPVPFADRYILFELLAVGGMAEIYLGSKRLGLGATKPVVVKRLRQELVGDPRMFSMFVDEARISTRLCHGFVIQAFDAAEEDGVPFIVLERVLGEELNQLARRGLQVDNFMPRALAVELIRQAAVALGYCHGLREDGRELGLVHCDVSPNNLLITVDGHVKLIDFGIAQFDGQTRRGESAAPGKLSYMSPEQARREGLDSRSDIFSLGIMLYEMTLGQRLFRGPAEEVWQRLVCAEVEPPTFVDHDYPGHLEGIVMKALELHPSERYQSAYELADDLAQYLVTLGRPIGAVEVARYVDELAVAWGDDVRPELAYDRDGGDDLDFDRHIGPHGERAQTGFQASQWDELAEDAEAIAAVLGVDPALIRAAGREPVAGEGLIGQGAVPINDDEGIAEDASAVDDSSNPAEDASAVDDSSNPAEDAAAVDDSSNPAEDASAVDDSSNPDEDAAAVDDSSNPDGEPSAERETLP